MSEISTVAVVGYDKCSEQDTITALEILRGAGMVLDGTIAPLPSPAPSRKLTVRLVNTVPGNITMQMGTQVVSDGMLADHDLFDLLYIPGGIGSGKMTKDKPLLDAIREHHSAGKIVAANCSGVGILFRAGILGDHPVTCVAAVARRLRSYGVDVPQARRMWESSPDGKVWTASGSYGVNGATVALVSYLFGPDVAKTVSMMFDTYGGLGEQIFSRTGPEYFFHPTLEADFQNYFEELLLPDGGAKK
jgi:transcriptional regulator GlxA family with amidase domain